LGLPFNISIGLPISNSQFAEILRMIIACFQYHEHNDTVKNHQATFIKVIENPVLNVLITNEIGEEQLRNISKSISKSKRLFFDIDWLAQNKISSEIIDIFFKKGTVIDCISAIELVINRFFEVQIKDFGDLEFVFANVLKNKINLIKEKIKAGVELNFKSFRSLTEDLLKNQRVPFEGESDTPLQIMSMLETRCIDFECVTIMTFNEGNLPSAKKINSFFPFDASKIFGLPLYSDQDAIMAYHFFRLLQRAKTLNFIYLNGASEALGNKEKSRFIRQVEEELTVYNPKIKIKYPILHFQNTENKAFKNGISVEKGNISRIQDFLSSKGLSATSINDYLSCSLKFYWKYIEKIRNEDELKSQIGTDVFGTIVHKVLENLDEPFLNAKTEIGVKELKVQKENIQKELALAIKESHKQFDFDNGMNLILLSVVQKILEKYFLKREKELSGNFRVMAIEKELFTIYSPNGTSVRLKGIIDKIESTSSFLRVIDYKTGKVEEKDLVVSKEENLAEILMNPKKTKLRQLVIYYYLINSNLESLEADLGEKIDMSRIRLLIYSFRNLTANLGFDTSNFSHTEIVEAVSGMLEKISQGLLDSEQLFEQTEDKTQCKYCDFIQVCQRG
jgi:CRISPR/Cas system-associated exonuclease Cas4 (RecB family)